MIKRHLIACLGALSAGIALSPGTALGMEAHVDCRAPFVFDGADVNVVVLPYRSAADSSAPLGEIGQRLALLVKLDVFSHILDYGSIGAVQMEVPTGVRDDSACEPESVIRQLLGQAGGAERQVEKGHGVVFVWGVLFEEEQDVVVQTYARFLRRDIGETIKMKAGGLEFLAKPNTATIAFSPQLFRKDKLHAVEASYAKADFVRTEPRDDAPGEPLPHPVAKCFGCGDIAPTGFQVEEKKGEWIHVRWRDPRLGTTREGWIHAAGGLAGESLDQILPELSFIEGAVGYLRQRVADSRGEHLSKALGVLTEQNFESFQKTSGLLAETRAAAAVGQQLSGVVQILQGDKESLVNARRHFDAAIQLTPYDANGITLGAVTQIVAEWDQSHSFTTAKLLADRLTAAGTLSDDPAAAIGNLRNFYKLLQTGLAAGAPQGLSSAVVAERLHEVELIHIGAP